MNGGSSENKRWADHPTLRSLLPLVLVCTLVGCTASPAPQGTTSPGTASRPASAAPAASLFTQAGYDAAWSAILAADVSASVRYVRVEQDSITVVDDLRRTWTWRDGAVTGPSVWDASAANGGTAAVLLGQSLPLADAHIADVDGLVTLGERPLSPQARAEGRTAFVAWPWVTGSDGPPETPPRALHVFHPRWGVPLEAAGGFREMSREDLAMSARTRSGTPLPLRTASDREFSAALPGGAGPRLTRLTYSVQKSTPVLAWHENVGDVDIHWQCSPCRLVGLAAAEPDPAQVPEGVTLTAVKAAHAWGTRHPKTASDDIVKVTTRHLHPPTSPDSTQFTLEVLAHNDKSASLKTLGRCTTSGACTSS